MAKMVNNHPVKDAPTEEEGRVILERAKALMRANKERAMLGPALIYDDKILNGEGSEYSDEVRNFQGIPSIECTRGGRIVTVFYSGKDDEGCGNFLLLHKSDDGGKTFGKAFAAVTPTAEGVRCFDPGIWVTPEGKLMLFWNQSYGYFDGRSGVWCAVCDDPDADEIRFGAPRRIANGVMMCKPIAKSNGDWLLPTGVWPMRPFYDTPDCSGGVSWAVPGDRCIDGFYYLPEEQYPNVYISRDKGENWELYGHTESHGQIFPEHMVFEHTDGTLGMYIRYSGKYGRLGHAESYDGGKTWTDAVVSDIYNPCTRFCVRRTPSGRLLLINHIKGEKAMRNNLSAQLSEDNGKTWSEGIILDERLAVSYPDAAFAPDGSIYVTYDYNRYIDKEILMAKITEDDILAGKIVSEGSQLKILVNKAQGKNPNECD